MGRWLRLSMVWLLMAAPLGAAAEEFPSYLILRTPKAKPAPHATYGYSPGRTQEVIAQGYSYGWFGVAPRQHWSLHFGTSRNYTQWSAR